MQRDLKLNDYTKPVYLLLLDMNLWISCRIIVLLFSKLVCQSWIIFLEGFEKVKTKPDLSQRNSCSHVLKMTARGLVKYSPKLFFLIKGKVSMISIYVLRSQICLASYALTRLFKRFLKLCVLTKMLASFPLISHIFPPFLPTVNSFLLLLC